MEESSSNIEQEIEDNMTTIKANFEEEYNQWESYFVLRRNYTESNVPYFVPSMQCYDAYTLYGSGESCYRPGSFSGIAFNNPRGITQDKYGNVYVADAGNHLIRKIQAFGQATNLAGMPCQWNRGNRTV